jgi:hypothetical protein
LRTLQSFISDYVRMASRLGLLLIWIAVVYSSNSRIPMATNSMCGRIHKAKRGAIFHLFHFIIVL